MDGANNLFAELGLADGKVETPVVAKYCCFCGVQMGKKDKVCSKCGKTLEEANRVARSQANPAFDARSLMGFPAGKKA
jgi:predicted amidophosphoribosyltransferase